MERIEIIKHDNPIPVSDKGAILFPFENWDSALTGDRYYSLFDQRLLTKNFIPLYFINQNPWDALTALKIFCFPFKEMVEYTCPYTRYVHFWALPLYLYTENIDLWINKIRPFYRKADLLMDKEGMGEHYKAYSEKGLKFNKIQRTMLGSGYTDKTLKGSGEGFLYDMSLLLSNGDYLAGKVWVWVDKEEKLK